MSKTYPFLDLGKVNEPYMPRLTEAALRVVQSGRYVGGEEVAAFEAETAHYLGAPFVIGVSNGLDALRLSLRAWVETGCLNEGDEIIVPANTYVASVLAVSDAGLVPVLTDPDPTTMNLSASGMRRVLTPRTKAVMPVHLYGRVAWDEDMASIVKDNGLLVLEDCAQAFGARAVTKGLYGSAMAGALGHAGALSFYPTKNIGALGDAGAVVTHDKEFAKTVRALANYGSDRRYHNIYKGFNCRLDPIQAAMLRVKIPSADTENADRFERALAYHRTISHPDVLTPLMSAAVTDCVWHQYVIRVLGGKRDRMKQLLDEQGVQTDIHYAVPPHLQPCYTELPHGPLALTEQLASEVLSLPIATGTSVKDVVEIAEIINRMDI